MKRPSPGTSGAGVPYVKGDDSLMERLPHLRDFMGDDKWDDGAPRVTGTLFLFMEGWRWKAMLKDRASGMIAFYTAHTLMEVLEGFNAQLASDGVDWKADRKPTGRGR